MVMKMAKHSNRNPRHIKGINQFKSVNAKRLFDLYTFKLLTVYPNGSDLRGLLEITTEGINEGRIVNVTIPNTRKDELPIELLRGGQIVTFDNLVDVQKCVETFYRLYIHVGGLRFYENDDRDKPYGTGYDEHGDSIYLNSYFVYDDTSRQEDDSFESFKKQFQ